MIIGMQCNYPPAQPLDTVPGERHGEGHGDTAEVRSARAEADNWPHYADTIPAMWPATRKLHSDHILAT